MIGEVLIALVYLCVFGFVVWLVCSDDIGP